MNKLFRNLITGSLIGVAVGVSMALMNKRQGSIRVDENLSDTVEEKTRGMIRMVRDNTKNFTRNVKENSEAFSKRLARRLS